jgi:hypothetical protein
MNLMHDALSPGSIIGLLSILVALLIYRASRIGARPVYQLRALRLIGTDTKTIPEAVEIRFKGQPVERLTKTHIVFWNSGHTLLRGSDVVEADPIRCEFAEGSRILEINVAKTSRTTNKFEAHIDPEREYRAIFTFDYLDPEDGAIVEMLHTDSDRYPSINGAIRGVPNGIVNWGKIRPLRTKDLPFSSLFLRKPALVTATLLGGLAVVGGIFLSNNSLKQFLKSSDLSSTSSLRIALVVVGVLYTVLPLLLLWMTRRRFPKNLQSPELTE